MGFREGTCGAQTQRVHCKVPCNWKKEFGANCKYKFESWGTCDGSTGTKARQGTLKKARYNAQCQETIRVTKPCISKTKSKTKGQRIWWGCGPGYSMLCLCRAVLKLGMGRHLRATLRRC